MTAKRFKGKAILQPLTEGSDYDRFHVQLTPEFEQLRDKAIELLYPFAESELNNISRYITYFTVDENDIGEQVCNSDECEKIKLEELKTEYPNSEIEVHSSSNDCDHENLETCSICGDYLNSQLTWVESEFNYIKSNKYTKKFIKRDAFTIYCILDAIPSCDHKASPWVIKEYKAGRTFHIDLRTKFYEDLMKLAFSVVSKLETKKI
jgi:hypothetical protein